MKVALLRRQHLPVIIPFLIDLPDTFQFLQNSSKFTLNVPAASPAAKDLLVEPALGTHSASA